MLAWPSSSCSFEEGRGTSGKDEEEDNRGVAGDKGASEAGCADTSVSGPSRLSIIGALPTAAQGAIVTERNGTSMSATCQLASAQTQIFSLALHAMYCVAS